MKSILLVLGLLSGMTGIAQPKAPKKQSFQVEGNCGMCKKHIENAATSLPGVSSATWNKNTRLFTVTYEPAKVSVDSIQRKIAAAGYDTPKYRGSDAAYEELDECCKYDRKPATKKSE